MHRSIWLPLLFGVSSLLGCSENKIVMPNNTAAASVKPDVSEVPSAGNGSGASSKPGINSVGK